MISSHEDGLGGRITILRPEDQNAPMRFRMILPKGVGPPTRERHPSHREEFEVIRGTRRRSSHRRERASEPRVERELTLPTSGHDETRHWEVRVDALVVPKLIGQGLPSRRVQRTRVNRG
jgi:hypothetical protein